MPRLCLFLAVGMFAGLGVRVCGQGVVASQGAPDPHEFHSPMVLEVPLLLTDYTRWNDKWTTEAEFANLRLNHCDGIFVERLKLRAVRATPDLIRFRASVKLRNPNDNHDKAVYLTFDVLSEGESIGGLRRAADATHNWRRDGGINVEESDSATREFVGDVPSQRIIPTSTLRITVKAINE